MRLSLLLLGLFGLAHAFAQNTVRPQPHWRLGEKRRADVQVTTRFTLMDSLHMETTATSAYLLEVTDQRKDHWVLTLRPDPDGDLLAGLEASGDLGMDSLMMQLKPLLKAVYEPLRGLEIRYRIALNGDVKEVLDVDEQRSKMHEGMREAMRNLMAKMGHKGEAGPLGRDVDHTVDSLYNAFVEVQKNEMDYLLSAYHFDFPSTGSVRQPAMIHDVYAPMHPEWSEVPAMLELGLDENTDAALACRMVTTYDNKAIAALLMKDHPDMKLDARNVAFTEENVDHIDKRTGWMTSSSRAVNVRMPQVTVNVVTRTVVRAY